MCDWGREGGKAPKVDAHTHIHNANLAVISDRLPASAMQQLTEMLQPPPSQVIDLENPPLANTQTRTPSHVQSHADMLPEGIDLLTDTNLCSGIRLRADSYVTIACNFCFYGLSSSFYMMDCL